jgi:hypothetical protein
VPAVLRIALAVVGVVLLASGVEQATDAHGCTAAVRDAGAHGAASDAGDIARRVREHCRSTDAIAQAGAALARGGAPRAGLRLARVATRRDPRNATAWRGVAIAAQQLDPLGARDARARAHALDPLA